MFVEAGEREVTAEDERIEQAARTAWDAFALAHGHEDELWRHQRTERQERWRSIASAVLRFAEPDAEAERLRSQLDGLRRAYEHACEQRDKYMRRAIEWRDAALNDTTVTVACTGCANACEGCKTPEERTKDAE